MSRLDKNAAASMPWLSAAWAVAMTGVGMAKWRDLGASDRAALALDAVACTAALRPLARRQALGWWTLYLVTVVQPVFGGVDVALNTAKWPSAIGRTAGAAVMAAGLIRMRRSYG